MSPQYKGKFPMELNAHNYSQKAVMSQTDLMRKKNKKECLLKKKKKNFKSLLEETGCHVQCCMLR